MWALDACVRQAERERWRKAFPGTEFTGFSEGRPVRLVWGERVIGHVCFGDVEKYGHLKCQRITVMDWYFLRSRPAGPERGE